MTRVAFIQPFLFRIARGIERYTVELASALVRSGVDVDILAWNARQAWQWDALDSRVGVYRIPTFRYFTAQTVVPFYLAHFLRNKYDMVYLHFADYGEADVINGLDSLGRSQPFSLVLQYPFSLVAHRYYGMQKAGLGAKASDIICISEVVERQAATFFSRPGHVIYQAVDADVFAPSEASRVAMRKKMELPEDAPVLLSMNALEERKGVQWVLRALPHLVKCYPGLVYLVVGSGPHEKALQQQVQDLNLQSHVRFVPHDNQVLPYYQTADIFLILARGEAGSLVSYEAMSVGLPIIAAQQPPFDEIISPEWGTQVQEDDALAVAGAIDRLLADDVLCKKMGQAGRSHIVAHGSWQSVAKQYMVLLHG